MPATEPVKQLSSDGWNVEEKPPRKSPDGWGLPEDKPQVEEGVESPVWEN